MSIEEYLNKKKNVQRVLLEYIEESDAEENYEIFIQVLEDQQILEDIHELRELLCLIIAVGNHHHRNKNFFSKIERILQHLKNKIIQYFTNTEIFSLFQKNKRLLLFLIEEKIMTVSEYFVAQITDDCFVQNKYVEYFAPEIKSFVTKEFIDKYCKKNRCLKNEEFIKEIKKAKQEDFYEKRKEGENENHLCELIRLQQTKEFIVHANKTNLQFTSCIPQSIFETNRFFLNKNEIKVIEYAAFYGSNEIIKYMHNNGVELMSSMWLYAIHSENAELIQYLEDNHISPPEDSYDIVLKESIKCHQKDVSNYIINYLIKEEDLQRIKENIFSGNLYRYSVKYHNYYFFPGNLKHKYLFYYLCEFDYYTLVNLYLENMNIDINETII